MFAPRLRRSVLYVPAANTRAMEKARGLPADVVVIDLEDSVAPGAKDAARAGAAEALRADAFPGREVVVRVNAVETEDGVRDLDALVPLAPDALLLPKIEAADSIERLCAALDEASAPRGLALWAMIETPKGVLNLPRIAEIGARRRLGALVAGVNDLAASMRCEIGPERDALAPILTQIVLAARAHGLVAIDGVYNRHVDLVGFAAEARQARRLGFDGKSLIHPDQIAPAHDAFRPSEDELDWARRVIAAYAAPGALERGAISVDGRMVERLHLEAARRTLAMADTCE